MEQPDRGRLTDLSHPGCFVELMAPIAVDSKVDMVMRISRCEIRGEGVVKSILPGFGVGIQFVHFDEAHLQRWNRYLPPWEKASR